MKHDETNLETQEKVTPRSVQVHLTDTDYHQARAMAACTGRPFYQWVTDLVRQTLRESTGPFSATEGGER